MLNAQELSTLVQTNDNEVLKTPTLARTALREQVIGLLWEQSGVEVGEDTVSSGRLPIGSEAGEIIHTTLTARRCVFDQASVSVGVGDNEPAVVVLDAMPSEIPGETAEQVFKVLNYVGTMISAQPKMLEKRD